MAESFPGAPGASGGSFPSNPDPDDATAHESDMLLFRRYRVRRELGRGGMGVVLLAHDSALDIEVAVKLIPDLMVKDTEAIADLRKEVLRGMALAHPGIVRTHNFEKDQSGAGIVMEFIDGESLTELKLKQAGKCFEPEGILPWIEQLCAVLDYAHHEAHIVHRDLKPRNIMLTKAGRVKVADFGIAAVVSDSMSRHSREGVVTGTLSYMSPQQAEGKSPNHRDDIYALGATIYELVTGKPPFFRGNPASIQAQVINVTPPSVAERRVDLEVLGRAPFPEPWEETLAACLAKDPAQRPQSAGEVLMRLKLPERMILEAPQGAAIFPSPSMPPVPEARTSPGTAGAAQGGRNGAPPWARVALLALVLGATGAVVFFRDDSPDPPSRDSTPPAATPPEPVPTLAKATKDAPFVNSLGQRFVPAGTPGVLFCVWETRVKDFAEFIRDSSYDMSSGEEAYTLEDGGWKQAGGNWRNPHFPEPQGEDHPVVCVSWEDAKAFCDWLTKKERAAGLLSSGEGYRLPTAHEWSVAVGIDDRADSTASPESRDNEAADVYPWGTSWPPPSGAGNLAGSEANIGAWKRNNLSTIDGYSDGFARTAPAGRFTPNVFGLCDLGGNVWEWCEDWWNPDQKYRVLRGGSWVNRGRAGLRSSYRNYGTPGYRLGNFGFRCVAGAAVGDSVR